MLQNGTGHGCRLHISENNNNKESENKATKKMQGTPGEAEEPSAAGQGKGWNASMQLWLMFTGTDRQIEQPLTSYSRSK
jgi:hypothetical protein